MKEQKLIAIGVDEDGQVWQGHFGASPYFLMFDVDGVLVEKRLNPYGPLGTATEHEHHGPGRIVKLLPECGVFIASHIGHPERLSSQFGIVAVFTSELDPVVALREYLVQHK